jgi:hypothetical protein
MVGHFDFRVDTKLRQPAPGLMHKLRAVRQNQGALAGPLDDRGEHGRLAEARGRDPECGLLRFPLSQDCCNGVLLIRSERLAGGVRGE